MFTDQSLNDYIAEKQKKIFGDTVYIAIRPDVIESLIRYAYYGVPTGGFLRAVLENDLKEAIARADHENQKALKAIVTLIYMELPSPCWGSPEKVRDWLKKFTTEN